MSLFGIEGTPGMARFTEKQSMNLAREVGETLRDIAAEGCAAFEEAFGGGDGQGALRCGLPTDFGERFCPSHAEEFKEEIAQECAI